MRQFTISAAALTVFAAFLASAPAQAEMGGGGPTQKAGQCFKYSSGNDKDGRFQMKITPPRMGDITYTTAACGKFFPIMTRYLTKDNERLIVAVMVKAAKK